MAYALDSQSSKMKYEELFLKPAVIAGLGAASGQVLFGSGTFNFSNGWSMPLWMASFVGVYGASLLAELAHFYLFPSLGTSASWNSPGTALLNMGLVAGGDLAYLYVSNPGAISDLGIGSIALNAAVSVAVGGYLWDNFLAPMLSVY